MGPRPQRLAALAREIEPAILQTRFLQLIFLDFSLTWGVSVDFSDPAVTLTTGIFCTDVLPFLSSAVTSMVCGPSASLPEPCHGARPTSASLVRLSVKLRMAWPPSNE